jgi:hypothetical protein
MTQIICFIILCICYSLRETLTSAFISHSDWVKAQAAMLHRSKLCQIFQITHTDCSLTIFVFLFIHLAQLKRCSSLLILKGVKGWVADVLGEIRLAKWAPRSSPPLGKRCSCEEEECGWVGRVVVPSNSHTRGLRTRKNQEEHIITT